MTCSLRRWPLSVLLIAATVGITLPASAAHKKKSQPAAETSSPPDAGASAKLDEPPEVPVGPPLVVVPLGLTPGHEADVAQAGYIAEEAVRRAKHQALVTLDDALDPTAAKARKKATAEGLRQLKAAHNAYDQLDMEVSSDLANRAIAGLTKGDLSRNFPQVVDAFELRVAAFASDPKTLDQAKAELGNLLPIDPRGELSPNLFNPDVIALAEGMRQKVKAASSLTLNVTTTPAAARVFVDGVFRGVSPLDVTNLAPGNHYVTIISPGFHHVMKRVNPGPDPHLELTLDPAERAEDLRSLSTAVAAAFHAPKLEGPLSQVATAFNADQVLVVALESPAGKPARVYAERGTASAPALLDDLDQALPGTSPEQAKVVDALVTDAVTKDHAIKSLRIAPVAVAASGGGSGGGVRYAGFAVLGVGVAAAVVGTVFGLGANSDVSSYKSTTQLNTVKSASLKSDGQSKALIANVSFGTAAVAGIAGTLMAIFGGPHAAAAPADDSAANPAPSPAPSSTSTPPPAKSTPSPAASSSSNAPPATKPSASTSSSSSSSPPAASSSSSSTSSSSPPPAKATASPASSSSSTTSAPSSTPAASPAPSSPSTPAPAAKPADSNAKPTDTKKPPPKDLGDDIKD